MGKEMEKSGAEKCAHGRREGRGTPTSIAGGVGGGATRSRNRKSLLSGLPFRGGARIFPWPLSWENRRTIQPKEIPSCLIPSLLNFTR